MGIISENVFEMTSIPTGINIADTFSATVNPRIFKKVLMTDSMLNFFPYGEVMINDKEGTIVSAYVFMEGMQFNTKFGSEPQPYLGADPTNPLATALNTSIGGFIQNSYTWAESQIKGTMKDSDYISGTNIFILLSQHYMADYVSTTAFPLQPSAIARYIANNVFGIYDMPNSLKIFIDETTNDPMNIWYQGNRTCRDFIEQTLVQNAVALEIPQSQMVPFVSFINCNGEFFFKSYASLYMQPPVASYTAKLSMDKTQDPFAVQELKFLCGGAPINKKIYNQEAYNLISTGVAAISVPIPVLLATHYLKMGPMSKYPVNIMNTFNTQSSRNFGLMELGDELLMPARQAFQYQDSATAFRIEIVVLFNAKCISGYIVDINVKKHDTDELASELCGSWLIIESEHKMDRNNVIYSHLTLARPSIPYGSDWPYAAMILP